MTDELDREILRMLSKDSRQTNTQVASKLNISEGTVRSRIQKLVSSKSIRRFTIETGAEGFSAIILLKTDPAKRTEGIVKNFLRLEGVKRAYEVSGGWDAVLIASLPDSEAYNELIETVRTTRGVIESQSLVALKVH